LGNIALKRDEKHEINPYRPPSAPGAFKIVRWKPVYDMIVAGHILGRSNKDLAAEFDYTPVTIANILRSDMAQKLIADAHDRIRANAVEKGVEVMDIHEKIKQKALKRVDEFLDNDELASNSPFAYMNTIAKYTSPPPSAATPAVNVNIQNNNQQNNVSENSLNRLTRALELSEGLVVDE
jgi:hypothetical protein